MACRFIVIPLTLCPFCYRLTTRFPPAPLRQTDRFTVFKMWVVLFAALSVDILRFNIGGIEANFRARGQHTGINFEGMEQRGLIAGLVIFLAGHIFVLLPEVPQFDAGLVIFIPDIGRPQDRSDGFKIGVGPGLVAVNVVAKG